MAAPSLTLDVGPFVSGAVRYQPLTPKDNGEGERFALCLDVRITNTGAAPVTVRTLIVNLATAAGVLSTTIKLQTPVAQGMPAQFGLTIAPGQQGAPKDFTQADTIVLNSTPPNGIPFSITADGFSESATFSRALARADQSFGWFGRPNDLARGEYWVGEGGSHCCGPQLYAYDLGCIGYDKHTDAWSELKPGAPDGQNASYRCWGKPVCAVADGVILERVDGVPTNTVGTAIPGTDTNGNHFLIQHGDASVFYSHMQSGTLAALAVGDPVNEGDVLGLVGNSGNSSAPHLHVHTIDVATGLLRPFVFHNTVMARSHPDVPGQAHWQPAADRAIPFQRSLIYPSPVPPADGAEWSRWGSLGGTATSAPAVASWTDERLDVFVRGTDNALYHKWFDGDIWRGWEGLGGTLTSAPAAVSWGPNRIDVFVVGTDSALYHKWWDGKKWHNWEGLGGTLKFAPAVCSRRPNHLDVFAAGSDGSLLHRIWTGSKWTQWENLGGVLSNSPSAVAWDDHRIDVFARGTDGMLYQKWWDATSWQGWTGHGVLSRFAPTVSSRRPNHLDVYTVAEDHTLWHRVWTGSKWSKWETLGGFLTEGAAAVSWDDDRIDVFGRGTDNAVYHTLWED